MNKKKTILAVVLIVIVILIASVIVIKNNFFNVDPWFKENKERAEAMKVKASLSFINITGQMEDYNSAKNGLYDVNYLVVLNKDGKVIDTRIKETLHNPEKIQEEYKFIETWSVFNTNIVLIENSIYYNTSMFNSLTKDEVIENFKNIKNFSSQNL